LFAELFVQTLALTIPGYFIRRVWLAKSWSGRWRLDLLRGSLERRARVRWCRPIAERAGEQDL